MAEFRKVSVLAGLVLLLGATGFAADNSFSCNSLTGNPTLVRAEGYSELVGDIVATCTGGTPTASTASVPQVNFTIYLNTNVTSRTYDTTGTSEALLLIDEPTTSGFVGCTSISGCTWAGGTALTAGGARKNVFRGVVVGNTVQFIGVPVDPPGTTGSRIFRFVNIRANANGVSSATSNIPGNIQAILTATGTTVATAPFSSSAVPVGYAISGLSFAVAKNTATSYTSSQCTSIAATNTTNSFLLNFTEGFQTAFKKRANGVTAPGVSPSASQAIPGNLYNTESGFYDLTDSTYGGLIGASTATNIGIAESGTRLKAVFANVPSGVSVYVSTNLYLNGSNTSYGSLIPGESGVLSAQSASASTFVGGTYGPATNTTPGYQLTVSNNTATAVWEVTTANYLASETYTGVVFFGYAAAPASNIPAVGTATVTGGFAPTPSGLGVSASVAAAASTSLSIPRFTDVSSSNTKSLLTIYTCRTNLLFPFVTNMSGFDTGIAIANTTTDPFGTAAQAGTCTVYSYGTNAPASFVTASVATGTVYTNLASVAMPNFQGYVIAQCGFQYAHGFAFISDFGSRNLAMGYLALIIPESSYNARATVPELLEN